MDRVSTWNRGFGESQRVLLDFFGKPGSSINTTPTWLNVKNHGSAWGFAVSMVNMAWYN